MAPRKEKIMPLPSNSASPEKRLNVLVTGGAGYIGSVLCPMLLERGHHVAVYDRLLYGRDGVEPLLGHGEFELVEGDIRQIQKRPDLFQQADVVVHLASLSNDPTCELRPSLTDEVNYRALVSTADMAKKHGVARFVFGSSCSVYGSVPGSESVDEDGPRRPVSLYAKTMVRSEDWLLAVGSEGFQPFILRQSTVFGYSPRMRFDLAINLMVKTAMEQKKIYVMGGGQQWRPFVHVRDTSRVLLAGVEGKLRSRILNVGFDDQNYRIEQLARMVAERMGNVSVEVVPDDADRRSYRVRFHRLSRELPEPGPTRGVEDGVDEIEEAIRTGVIKDPNAPKTVNLRVLKAKMALPAIAGGEPAFSRFFPFSLPKLGKAEEKAVLEVLRSGWLTTGPKVLQFEEKCRERLGCAEAVAVSSCTAALHLSLVALAIGPGNEVITSPITFPATANVILHVGATPIFCDVEPGTLNLDVEALESLITPKTRAILPVHMAGRPCDMARLWELAERRGIAVIEDAAHAFGSRYETTAGFRGSGGDAKKLGGPVGSGSPVSCFSFYPIKNFTTIEGGLMAVNRPELAQIARVAALHGLSRDAWNRYGAKGTHHWDVVLPGYKYNMSDVQAAIGLCQLQRLDGFLEKRRKTAAYYREALGGVEGIQLLDPPHEGDSHHLFIILVQPEILGVDRDRFTAALREENIGTGIHFRALHLMTAYRERFGFQRGMFPVAEAASDRLLSLPLYPAMEYEAVERVAEAVRKLADYLRRGA